MALVGTADLLLRRATLRGVTPASFMVLQSWFFGSTALGWAVATGSLRWSRVFTFLLAAPLFGEPVTPRKLSGLVAAILAILAFYQ